MNWRMIGKPFATLDMGSLPTISQRILIGKSISLDSVQLGLVIYNNPTFTSLNCKIYSDDSGSPRKLLHTSTTSWLKAQINTLDHGYKFVGFSFNKPLLKSSIYYHIVLDGVGYVGNDGSHLAWRQAYPDPQYRNGLTLEAANADNHPFEYSIIGAEIE